ncbi:MAG: hypothetical protein KJ822_17555 [Proteobacteria bacterium]|nr:hypothetical protein [Pseudomonadota bacterium]
MASKLEHLSKAEHNENFYQSFDFNSTPYLDWVVNAIFYSAVHYIESYLAIQEKQPITHAERKSDIKDDNNLGLYIFRKYRSLKDDSEGARYYMQRFTPGEIQLLISQLYDIKDYLKKYIPEIQLA